MNGHLFPLQNRGMSRDMSISKEENSMAWENLNIRVTAREHDTLLSVTNERGTKEIELNGILEGTTLIGWNVLNNHVILFTTETEDDDPQPAQVEFGVSPAVIEFGAEGGTETLSVEASGPWELTEDTEDEERESGLTPDRIYRIDYDGTGFSMVCGDTEEGGADAGSPLIGSPLYVGDLGFDAKHPIESIVYYETANIQKIYWLDGKNVLRFMNFTESLETRALWNNTYFDSNRRTRLGLNVSITKDNSGNTRANGVVQYLITYHNMHGQETGYVWVSDLVYLSPRDKGGSPDGTNSNSVTLSISGLYGEFSRFRVYAVFRSSLDGTVSGYLVSDNTISGDTAIVVDDGNYLSAVDATSLLYLGGHAVVAGTMTHKDQTLFLGDLRSVGKNGTEKLEKAIHGSMFDLSGTGGKFVWGSTWEAKDSVVSFMLTFGDVTDGDAASIPYVENAGLYPNNNQLELTSSKITTFKGGEKYRFGLMFRTDNGKNSTTFWIGDKVNPYYPEIDAANHTIRRPLVRCVVPVSVVNAAVDAGYVAVTLMTAKADYSDRSVLAQGIVNPTMFNVWDRYQDRLYSCSSWLTRPRNSGFASSHFEPVHNSTSTTGELQCNFWDGVDAPTPYYRQYTSSGMTDSGGVVSVGDMVDTLQGKPDFDHWMILYRIYRYSQAVSVGYMLFRVTMPSDAEPTDTIPYGGTLLDIVNDAQLSVAYNPSVTVQYTLASGKKCKIFIAYWLHNGRNKHSAAYSNLYESLLAYEMPADYIIDNNDFVSMSGSCDNDNDRKKDRWFAPTSRGLTKFMSIQEAIVQASWQSISAVATNASSKKYLSSFYKKHLYFVDENIVTVNSPELEQEAVSFDSSELNFRIVGVAKVTGNISDYVVETGESKYPGQNLVQMNFSSESPSENPDGLLSYPLFTECGLLLKGDSEDGKTDLERTDDDFKWTGTPVWYWLHMWHKSGGIPGIKAGNGYDDDSSVSDAAMFSDLQHKVFANMRYSYETVYSDSFLEYSPENIDIRQYSYLNSQYVNLNTGNGRISYNANLKQGVGVPGSLRYPILYSAAGVANGTTPNWFMGCSDPVVMAFRSTAHAVVSLGMSAGSSNIAYTILPKVSSGGAVFGEYTAPEDGEYDGAVTMSAGKLPWSGSSEADDDISTFSVNQATLECPGIVDNTRYLFIGELYRDFDNGPIEEDSRYGGISQSAVESNIFVTAGPQVNISAGQEAALTGNQGDTYFQRWDCLKTKPYSETDVNGVVDITSVMVESHINLDGRYDTMRGQQLIASIDTTEYGSINPVYSQTDDFFPSYDADDDAMLDSYRSSITWTMQKGDGANIDAWTHITLASSLKLDGDKGVCRALRRFQNTILAFQDKGIAEVMFNSRTQMSTTDGVPVELANSGKVDGKRYLTNKYGCINKWSIVEGKAGLYFVDNINKMLGVYNGQGIDSLSSKSRFDVWMRERNSMSEWTPDAFGNFVSYYDRVHSDVYFISDNVKNPCIVYNEQLGCFTGFFDYYRVPMMTNVGDRFISYRDGSLWLQNEGKYLNFFGTRYPCSMTYRVTPEPYGDKIWTNLEYRADFFDMSDGSSEDGLQDADEERYLPDVTFDYMRVWNEYQSTEEINPYFTVRTIYPDIRKKFRIWRMDIPRAKANDTNRFGLDRIRNPWVFVKLMKSADQKNDDYLMHMHDLIVKYFSNE